MSEEWGPWIEHDGKTRPLRNGEICEVVRANGDSGVIRLGDPYACKAPILYRSTPSWFLWVLPYPAFGEVIRYRIRKPKGLTLLEGLLENLPEGVGQ